MRRGGTGAPAAVVIAVAGVALAMMVMLLTSAVVVGFKDGIRSKLMGFDAQVTVLPAAEADGRTGAVALTPQLRHVISEAAPEGAEVRLALRQPGILKTDTDFEGVIFIGQSPEAAYDFERANIKSGVWPDYRADSTANHIVISEATARALDLDVGDKVFATFIIDGQMKLRRNTVAGLYRSDFGEYDRMVVYTSLASLQRVAGVDSLTGTRIDIRGIAPDDIDAASSAVARRILDATARAEIPSYHPVTDIHHTGAVYFNWLDLLDTNVVVIYVLMLAVAGFTLVSSLFILILERLPMIGLLRAMGATRPLIRRIFVDLGLRLVGTGMIIGNALGIALMFVQKYTHFISLDPQMYYLGWVPIAIRPLDIILINIGVAVAAWAILIIPARSAAASHPAANIYRD